MKETNASAGPQVTKEIKASENKVTKEPQGLAEKNSPQEPPLPLDRVYLVKRRRALATGKSLLSSLVAQDKNKLAKKTQLVLARKNVPPSDSSDDNKPLSALGQKARGFQDYMDRQDASK
eukprot:2438213-Ditylum_brightwellii.AAC.1